MVQFRLEQGEFCMVFYTVLYGSFILISGLKQAVLWDPVFSSISSNHTCIPFMFWIIHSTKTQGHILSILMIYIATHHCLGELKSTAHKTWMFFHILIITFKFCKIIKEVWEVIRLHSLHRIWIVLAFSFSLSLSLFFLSWMVCPGRNTSVNKCLMKK